MLHLTFLIFIIFCFVHSLSEDYKNIFFSLEISLIFLYNFCLFPRHPTFFFLNWHMIPKFFYILIRLSPWRTVSRLFQRSIMFVNFSYLSSTWHLERLFEETRTKKTMPRYKLLQDAFGTSDVERRLNACVRTVHEENRWQPKKI